MGARMRVCVRVCACVVRPCFGMPMYCHILFFLLLLCGVQRHVEGLYLFGSKSKFLTFESFCMPCSMSWMASLIDNLHLLDLIVWVIN